MKIFIGADHRGFELKQHLITWLKSQNHEVVDCGNATHDPSDDYPDFAIKVGEDVVTAKDSYGIVICGSGAGVAIAANKVIGVRCAQGFTPEGVKNMRADDDVNVLALGADELSVKDAEQMVETFLTTKFSGEERHKRRTDKIFAYEYGAGGGCCGGHCTC